MTVVPVRKQRTATDRVFKEIGRYIPIDLDVLIEKIYVSPKAEHWLGEVVESVLRSLGQDRHRLVISKLYSLG
jgi:hypothetical protein